MPNRSKRASSHKNSTNSKYPNGVSHVESSYVVGCPRVPIPTDTETHSQIMPNCQKVNTLARISSQNWHLSVVTFSADTLKVSKAARVLHIGGRARERATERSEAKNARSHRGYIEVASHTTVRAPHRASGSFSVGRRCLQNPQLDFSTSGLFTSEEAGGHGGGFEERRGCRREQGTSRVITHLEITSEAPNGVRSHRAVYTPRISGILGTHRRRTC